MVFEAVLVALAAHKGFSHIVQFAKYGNWWCPKMLTGVLVRDSVLYFAVCVRASVAMDARRC
jgi:hypothetical protein